MKLSEYYNLEKTQSQLDFIDKYRIKYIFANKDAYLSEIIMKRIHKVIVDSISGEQFYILKN